MDRTAVLFVQGAGDMSAPDGSGVLAEYLTRELGDGLEVIAPEMPDAASEPSYEPWRDEIRRKLREIGRPALLVGHSFGGSTILKYLAEETPPQLIRGLFLVAVPWWGPEGWDIADYAPPVGFGAEVAGIPTFLYHSRGDPHVPFDHMALYEAQLPDATARPQEGSEHSFVNGLPALVDDIREVAAA